MLRPWLRWLLFATCLTVFVTALGWMSLRMVRMEEARALAETEAEIQEKMRLSLWRMESIASALLIRENARPVSHYQSFRSAGDLILPDNQPLPGEADALTPSPLLTLTPDLVLLHFEVLAGQSSPSSPQAPIGAQCQLANQWYAVGPEMNVATTRLAELTPILRQLPLLPPAVEPPLIKAPPPTPQPVAIESKQAYLNNAEYLQRSNVVQNQIALEKSAANSLPMKKAEAAPPPRLADDTPQEVVTRQPVAQPEPGDLQATWIDDQLLLYRSASLLGVPRWQGVWVDWSTLQQRLKDSIQDLLPSAQLIPLPDSDRADPTALVTLPLRLLPGVTLPPVALTWQSPVLRTLVLAWACLLATAIAIALVLHRAITLSERRGAFVSAVTHELRTPLTTFQLYSEMLADDMVTDPDQRRSYLHTLSSESTRLMHLVENVLAYSRIERGRTAARMETVTVGALLDRAVPRLKSRAAEASLQLVVDQPASTRAISLSIDVLAIEQILFNLVDNAAKYAHHSDPAELHLTVSSAATPATQLTFDLRDFGPGIPAAQRKKLFQPFSKSATEAAHSAPGVGLGLALCRRLARELRGDLTYIPPDGPGTQFRLSLPLVK